MLLFILFVSILNTLLTAFIPKNNLYADERIVHFTYGVKLVKYKIKTSLIDELMNR